MKMKSKPIRIVRVRGLVTRIEMTVTMLVNRKFLRAMVGNFHGLRSRLTAGFVYPEVLSLTMQGGTIHHDTTTDIRDSGRIAKTNGVERRSGGG